MLTALLFPVIFLSIHSSLVNGAPEPVPTFTDTDPITGKSLVCERCPPGTFLRARCTETQKSECAPCPNGSFTELWNYIGKCLRCGVCGHNMVVKTGCTAKRDCQCQCRPGYYYKMKYDMCLRHSECHSGQEVLNAGSPDEDTVCRTCPNGTYSDIVSAHKNCTEHKDCEAAGLQLALKGSVWHNSVCMDCQGSTSKDGAEYLREILPAFFVHQKMAIRRLRQILRRLLSEENKRHEGISGLYLPELLERINTWVSSATAAHIRQLPAILTKTGANNAAERLQNKLQRIDSNVALLCGLNNVMDVQISK
ncbi:tumor necrosis factor receptor superfamily member 6B-like [Xyrichtys novacula]|nr:tumor necrosis factor receptor superfamily member 6B-like [Xyrichtys novacula]